MVPKFVLQASLQGLDSWLAAFRTCKEYGKDTAGRLKELDCRPQVGFDEGLAETIDWYRENESWWRTLQHDH